MTIAIHDFKAVLEAQQVEGHWFAEFDTDPFWSTHKVVWEATTCFLQHGQFGRPEAIEAVCFIFIYGKSDSKVAELCDRLRGRIAVQEFLPDAMSVVTSAIELFDLNVLVRRVVQNRDLGLLEKQRFLKEIVPLWLDKILFKGGSTVLDDRPIPLEELRDYLSIFDNVMTMIPLSFTFHGGPRGVTEAQLALISFYFPCVEKLKFKYAAVQELPLSWQSSVKVLKLFGMFIENCESFFGGLKQLEVCKIKLCQNVVDLSILCRLRALCNLQVKKCMDLRVVPRKFAETCLSN
ncbi:MAG: hypothetical protein KBC64_02385 [Simkaniaceae bacterium]|nr:hypothetical protein [Simkaniaceae bacterium]